jgi:ribosomal protein L35AE/L33A
MQVTLYDVEGYGRVSRSDKGFRQGGKTQYQNQCLIEVLNVPGEAETIIGWKVFWPANKPKIRGTIVKKHGNQKVLRVRMNKGLPGQAINDQVKIKE